MGGSGFTVFTIRNQRLAYLQVLKDTPPQPMPGGNPRLDDGALLLKFFQLDNGQIWEDMAGGRDAYGVLRMQARYGNLQVRKVIKSPSGVMRARQYHIQHGRWQQHLSHERLGNDEPTFDAGTLTLPRIISVTYSHSTLYPLPQEHIT